MMYTVHGTLYDVRRALYAVNRLEYGIKMYIVQQSPPTLYVIHSVHRTLYAVQFNFVGTHTLSLSRSEMSVKWFQSTMKTV